MPKQVRGDESQILKLSKSTKSRSKSAGGNNETKSCPFCAETIQFAAAKCRYCGESLDGHRFQSAKQPTRNRRASTTIKRNRSWFETIAIGIGALAVAAIGLLFLCCGGLALLETNRPDSKLTQRQPGRSKAELVLEKPPPDPSRAILGRWLFDAPVDFYSITIYSEPTGTYMERQFGWSGPIKERLIESKMSTGRRFTMPGPNPKDEHWILDHNGNLHLRDDEGLIVTMKKID
ncbi:MAG: hypothetical protein AB7U20_07665 [Planctomycetaceae bacterium]